MQTARRLGAVFATAAIVITAGACVPAPNPNWPADCNLKVALLIDRSSSIEKAGDAVISQVKTGAMGFVSTLFEKNQARRNPQEKISLYVNAFATDVVQVYPASTQLVGKFKTLDTRDDMLFAQAGILWTSFDSSTYPLNGEGAQRGLTNWQGALARAPQDADLVVMLTDGDPTWHDKSDWVNGGSLPKTEIEPEDVDAAIAAANALKGTGTRPGARIIAVHFGNRTTGGPYDSSERRLQLISGTTRGDDYYLSSSGNLKQDLEDMTSARVCKPPTTTTTTRTTTTTTTATTSTSTTTTTRPLLNPT